MLRTALGPAVARFLDDADIVYVMLDPDERLWINQYLSGPARISGRGIAAADLIDPRD